MVATIKVRNFYGAKEVLEGLGVEPAGVLESVGLDGGLFSNRETVILYADALRFIVACARATRRDDFGLLVGMRQDAAAVGLVGLMSLSAMRVGEALQIIATGLRTSDTGGVFFYEARNGSLYLSYVVTGAYPDGVDQIVDGSIAVACNAMRQFCGSDWRPDKVLLSRQTPRDAKAFRQFFGVPVEFGAPAACLACDAAVLNQPVKTHNPHHMDILAPLYDAALSQANGDLVSTLKAVLTAQVGGGRLTRARAARAMGISEHCLVKRMGEANTTFSDLAEDVKYQLARQMLASGKDMRAIAGELGFADASVFNRAFVKWSGQTPGRWRSGRIRAPDAAD